MRLRSNTIFKIKLLAIYTLAHSDEGSTMRQYANEIKELMEKESEFSLETIAFLIFISVVFGLLAYKFFFT